MVLNIITKKHYPCDEVELAERACAGLPDSCARSLTCPVNGRRSCMLAQPTQLRDEVMRTQSVVAGVLPGHIACCGCRAGWMMRMRMATQMMMRRRKRPATMDTRCAAAAAAEAESKAAAAGAAAACHALCSCVASGVSSTAPVGQSTCICVCEQGVVSSSAGCCRCAAGQQQTAADGSRGSW